MDKPINNTPTGSDTITTGGQTPITKDQNQEPVQTSTPVNKQSPTLLFVLLAIIIILAIVAFLVPSNKKESPPLPYTPTATPYDITSPTPNITVSEEQEVNEINLEENIDEDFTTIDQDLKQL